MNKPYTEKVNALKQYIPIKHFLKYTGEIVNGYVSHNLIIENAVKEVECATLKNILILHYIDGMTFEEIAVKMHYCEKQIQRLHKKAIEVIKL